MNKQNQFGLVDLTYLREISGNDADFIKEMLNMFLEQTPDLMTELNLAIEKKDPLGIKSSAHKVKPTFAMIGRDDMKDAMQSIENLSKESDSISRIKDVFNTVSASLEVLFKDITLAKNSL